MSDQYLVDVQAKTAQAETRLQQFANAKDRLIKDINDLNTVKKNAQQVVDIFLSQEFIAMMEQIREYRETARHEKEKHTDFLSRMRSKAKKIQEDTERLEEKEHVLEGKSERLTAQAGKQAAQAVDLQELFKTLTRLLDTASTNEEVSVKDRDEARQLLDEANEVFANTMTDVENKSMIISEKEKLVDKKYQIAAVKEQMLDQKEEWIRIQEKKISEQWTQILESKKFLDEQCGKG